MAKMYYTLAETKSALAKSEDEIRQFILDGRLREFRDGPRLILKGDQVEALKLQLCGGGSGTAVESQPSDTGSRITTLMQPTPRRIRLRARARLRVWLFRLATIPFIAFGVFLGATLLEKPITLMFGSDITVRVKDVHRLRDQFDVTLSYEVTKGILETSYDSVDTSPPAVGQVLPARALIFGPYRWVELTNQSGKVSSLVCGGLLAFLWCSIVGIFSVAPWLGPILNRRLLQYGEATVGIVTGKNAVGKNPSYEVSYRYQSADGIGRVGKSHVPYSAFKVLNEGQSVAVLYRATQPARSALYEASLYEIVEDTDSNPAHGRSATIQP